MRVVVQDTIRNRQWIAYQGSAGFAIGRDEFCQVRLESRFVSKIHARVDRGPECWELSTPAAVSPIEIDGDEVEPGQVRALAPTSQLRIAEFVIILDQEAEAEGEAGFAIEALNQLQQMLHESILRRMDLRATTRVSGAPNLETLEQVNAIIDDLLHTEFHSRVWEDPQARRALLGVAYQVRIEVALAHGRSETARSKTTPVGVNEALESEVQRQVDALGEHLGINFDGPSGAANLNRIMENLQPHVDELVQRAPENVQFYVISQLLKKLLYDMIFGLGPLQDLLDLPDVSEIMVVEPSLVYIERNGRVFRSNRTFVSAEATTSIIERIVAPLGRRIDHSQPLVDARLSDGSRVNAVIPPLALRGPCLTIRRFPKQQLTAEDLTRKGSITRAAIALIEACVRYRRNIIVAGGTGSGKTTMLNVLSAMIPADERIVTIEDAAELQLQQEHVVSLETRVANVEGVGAYTIRDLVRNALRMRPDRLIVGECRGAEALDMLQAMNTGHSGSLTTVHANSAQDVVSRLETMVLTIVDMPLLAIRRQIAQAIDLIVYLQRTRSGRRLTTQVSEVVGLHPISGEIEIFDIMDAVEIDGEMMLKATGYIPSFLGQLVEGGFLDLDQWFGRITS